MAAHRESAVRAEVIVAAVDRGAARAGRDPGLAQDRDGLTLAEGRFQRAQLGVDLPKRVQLVEHQLIVALAEAMQVEDEPAEVAVGELPSLAQEARSATCASPRAEAGRCCRGRVRLGRALSLGGDGRLGTSGLTVVRRLGRSA